MTRAAMGGLAILPPGQIDDPTDPKHRAPIFSTSQGQTTPHRLVTRRAPVNFGVCCLIDLIQRENVAREARIYYDECAEEARRDEAQAIQDSLRYQHPLGI